MADNTFDIRTSFFNIDTEKQTLIEEAVAKWETIITADIPDVTRDDGSLLEDDLFVSFGTFTTRGNLAVTDINPDNLRPDSQLPYSSRVEYNLNEIDSLSGEAFYDITFHEIGHALGINRTVWEPLGLVEGGDTSTPRFLGQNATEQYNQIFGNTEDSVPMGSAGGHWSEEELGNEIMTSNIDEENVLSGVTIGSLEDIGYQVDYEQADDEVPTLDQPADSPLSISSGDDLVFDRKGSDNLNGVDGNDTLYGEESNDNLVGGNGRDSLYGQADNDTLFGNNSNDALFGGSGDDELFGGNDDDYLSGEDGDDYLSGGSGNDNLKGRSGDDVLVGYTGDDTLEGGEGADSFVFNYDNSSDTIIDYAASEGDTIEFLDSNTLYSVESTSSQDGDTTITNATINITDPSGNNLSPVSLSYVGTSDIVFENGTAT